MIHMLALLQAGEPVRTGGPWTNSSHASDADFAAGFETANEALAAKQPAEVVSVKSGAAAENETKSSETKTMEMPVPEVEVVLAQGASVGLQGKESFSKTPAASVLQTAADEKTLPSAAKASALTMLKGQENMSALGNGTKQISDGAADISAIETGGTKLDDIDVSPQKTQGKAEDAFLEQTRAALPEDVKSLLSSKGFGVEGDVAAKSPAVSPVAKLQDVSTTKVPEKKKMASNDSTATTETSGVAAATMGTVALTGSSQVMVKPDPVIPAPESNTGAVHPMVAASRRANTATVANGGSVSGVKDSGPASGVDGSAVKEQSESGTSVAAHETAAATTLETPPTKVQESVVAMAMMADAKVTLAEATGGIKAHADEGVAGLVSSTVSTIAGESDVSAAETGGRGTLMATPTSLDVGVANGTHGWLRIRAELNDGAVTASLSATSGTGQAMLHRELPSLTTFLAQEQLTVKTVVVDRVVSGDGANSSNGAGAERSGQEGQSQSGLLSGDNPQRRGGQQSAMQAWSSAEQAEVSLGGNENGMMGVLSEANDAGGGSWLSVRV